MEWYTLLGGGSAVGVVLGAMFSEQLRGSWSWVTDLVAKVAGFFKKKS